MCLYNSPQQGLLIIWTFCMSRFKRGPWKKTSLLRRLRVDPSRCNSTNTHSAKSPKLLNQYYNLDGLQDLWLKAPSPTISVWQRCKDILTKGWHNELINEIFTDVFVQQPLALPGSANKFYEFVWVCLHFCVMPFSACIMPSLLP